VAVFVHANISYRDHLLVKVVIRARPEPLMHGVSNQAEHHTYLLRPSTTQQQSDRHSSTADDAGYDTYDYVVPCKRRMTSPPPGNTFLQFNDGLAQLDPISVVVQSDMNARAGIAATGTLLVLRNTQ
jgi:hypothetical protein